MLPLFHICTGGNANCWFDCLLALPNLSANSAGLCQDRFQMLGCGSGFSMKVIRLILVLTIDLINAYCTSAQHLVGLIHPVDNARTSLGASNVIP